MSNGRRTLGLAVATGLTAVTAAALTPATATASQDTGMATVTHKSCKDETHRGAEGLFNAKGDWFTIRDTCNDGHSAQLQVDMSPLGGTDWRFTLTTGWGDEQTFQRENLPENRNIRVRVCVTDGSSHVVNCGGWQHGET
ncbi:hypothetical protein [Kribbella endophytica]